MKTDWKNRLGVHILTRQRNPYLACLLHSLLEQTHTNWDLFILDNNDKPYYIDKDHLIVSIIQKLRWHKHAVYIIRPQNDDFKRNIGQSRNILIDVSSNDYKYAVRIDDDSILDKDYLKKLWWVMGEKREEKIGAVGGVVPSYAQVELYKYPPKIFNIIQRTPVPERYLALSKKYPELGGFKNEDEEYYNVGEPLDDGAYLYHPDYPTIIPSHHLRSSYLFDIPALLQVGGFPSSDDTGFREETIASINLLDKGYKLYTQTQAIAWHLWSPNLGRGYSNKEGMEEHERKILRNELKFQRGYRTLLRKLFN